jgi:RNA polymerase sigma-70 factor (ECF subfamily)
MTNVDVASNPVTFESLLTACTVPAYQLAHAMLGDRQDAEDAVQEAAVKAWATYQRWRHEASFRSWFLTIVANQCRSMRRTRWWRLRQAVELPEVPQLGHEERTVRRLDLQGLLDRLSGEQRALLYLCFELDLPHAEIGRILGVRTGAVKTRRHRLVRQLQRAAGEEEIR